MSVQDARDYVADPNNWMPEEVEDVGYVPGEEELYAEADVARIALHELADRMQDQPALDTGELDTDFDQPEVSFEQREVLEDVSQDADYAYRSEEAVEADVELVCGPAAIAKPMQARHYATLRLIDDLTVARALLADMAASLQTMRPGGGDW